MDKKKIVIIAGPTASGKSSLAVSAAELIGGEIISCDSMQIYKYMDIGTAKITREEMRGVPHYMLDLVDPRSEYSVSEFSREAKALIDKISARSHIPVLVGGTGLYIESIIYPLSFVVNKDDGVRKRLFEEYEKYGAKVMHERLLKIDPVDAAKIHPHNVKRLLRALEIYELSGKTKSEQDERTIDPSYDIKLCVMIPERAELYENINARVEKMFSCGILDEVKKLLDMGVKWSDQSMQAIGYKEFKPYFDGHSDLDAVKETIKKNTRNYAKRQITWFKRYDFPDVYSSKDKEKMLYDIKLFGERQ